MYSQEYFLCLHYNILMSLCHNIGKIAFQNGIKHDRVCISVTEIKDHAKNFPNAPCMVGGP